MIVFLRVNSDPGYCRTSELPNIFIIPAKFTILVIIKSFCHTSERKHVVLLFFALQRKENICCPVNCYKLMTLS